MQPCLPVNYITHQNICPHFLCMIFLLSGHILSALSNPPLSPIIWKIKNMFTPHHVILAICFFREPYVYFISRFFFYVIRQILSVIVHFMFLPKARIRFITYLTIFSFHCLHHIIYHSIKHLLIWHIRLWFICTLYIGLY